MGGTHIWYGCADVKISVSPNFRVSKKIIFLQISVSPNLKWSCQRCTSVVVPVYRMLPWGGGCGNLWLKNNVVPKLGQHWDFASIDNHYTTIFRVPNPPTSLLTGHWTNYGSMLGKRRRTMFIQSWFIILCLFQCILFDKCRHLSIW